MTVQKYWKRVGNSVASPTFPLTLGLVFVVMGSLGTTSIIGLDSIEDPVAGIIGSIPHISVDRLDRNRDYTQISPVSILCTMGIAFVEISSSLVTAVG